MRITENIKERIGYKKENIVELDIRMLLLLLMIMIYDWCLRCKINKYNIFKYRI